VERGALSDVNAYGRDARGDRADRTSYDEARALVKYGVHTVAT
jgi:hypothetical protein